jgi:hypothetical protein
MKKETTQPLSPKMVAEREPALILAFSLREKEVVVPASGKSGRAELAPVQGFHARNFLGTSSPELG